MAQWTGKKIGQIIALIVTYKCILLIENVGFFLALMKFNGHFLIISEFHSSKFGKLRDKCSLSDGLVGLENDGIL
jgi:hypothetical protein